MSAISQALNRHHVCIEGLIAETLLSAQHADWRVYRVRFGTFKEALLEHMDYEEEEIFPALEPAVARPLRDEHATLRIQAEALSAAAPEHDPQGCLFELTLLERRLKEHHRLEMHACDPASDRLAAVPPPRELNVTPALDLRGLQPPEPIMRIFHELERDTGSPLRVILPHEPLPLYGMLSERGYRYSGSARTDGGFEVLIERA